MILDGTWPADPLNLNRRGTVRQRITSVAPWRDLVFYLWAAELPKSRRAYGGPAVVDLELRFTGNHRRDPINYAPTVKAMVDGLVLAGAWPDDTPDHVVQNLPNLVVDPARARTFTLTITPR